MKSILYLHRFRQVATKLLLQLEYFQDNTIEYLFGKLLSIQTDNLPHFFSPSALINSFFLFFILIAHIIFISHAKKI